VSGDEEKKIEEKNPAVARSFLGKGNTLPVAMTTFSEIAVEGE